VPYRRSKKWPRLLAPASIYKKVQELARPRSVSLGAIHWSRGWERKLKKEPS
jgi:hypothetical protein